MKKAPKMGMGEFYSLVDPENKRKSVNTQKVSDMQVGESFVLVDPENRLGENRIGIFRVMTKNEQFARSEGIIVELNSITSKVPNINTQAVINAPLDLFVYPLFPYTT